MKISSRIKKLGILGAVLISFYGVAFMSPSLAFADNGSNGKNENHSATKQIKQEMKQEIKQIKEKIKPSFSWGAFMSSIRKNSNPNKFSDWFWGSKNLSDSNNEDKNKSEIEHNQNGTGQNNQAPRISNIRAVPGETSAVINWSTSQLASGAVMFGTSSTTLTSSVSESGSLSLTHQVALTGLTPNTMYFYVINAQNASSTMATSSIRSFKTASTTSPADTTSPNIIFATNIGNSTSTTKLIWVTDESSDSKIWISTIAPVSTTTAPVASSGTLSFFHQLSIPGLATSTLYYYMVGSTDSLGNTGYFSNSFTTPAI